MKAYLLTAAGAIFLSVIVSLLIPEGKLNKSIVFVMRIVCILVLIRPITGVFQLDSVSVDDTFFDYTYICKVYSENQSVQLEKLITENFGEIGDCAVAVIFDEGEFKVSGVTVLLDRDETKIIDDIYEYLEQLGYINITVYAKSD